MICGKPFDLPVHPRRRRRSWRAEDQEEAASLELVSDDVPDPIPGFLAFTRRGETEIAAITADLQRPQRRGGAVLEAMDAFEERLDASRSRVIRLAAITEKTVVDCVAAADGDCRTGEGTLGDGGRHGMSSHHTPTRRDLDVD